MNKNQVIWAARHDWFVGCKLHDIDNANSWTVEVIDRSDPDTVIEFDSYTDLRIWAGY